jgi:hypothetical protein
MGNNIKIGAIELTAAECAAAMLDKREFVVGYRTIYQLTCSKNAGWYGVRLYREYGETPIMGRGRFAIVDGAQASKLSHGAIAA